MEKSRQKYLQKWLWSQQKPIRRLLNLNIMLASVSSVILVINTYFLANLLHHLIMLNTARHELLPSFIGLVIGFALRAIILWVREQIGFKCGRILRNILRQKILDKIHQVGPATINNKPAGSWATIMLEQVENLHNYYARYLPQQALSAIVPVVILIAIFPLNWAAGLVLMITAPLIPIFMILVGIAAADSSQKNMATLAKLSGQFLDRLRGLETLRLFNRTEEQTQHIEKKYRRFSRNNNGRIKDGISFLCRLRVFYFHFNCANGGIFWIQLFR
ncbi:ATP-binding/permease protein CydD [Pasteurella multocida]|nr:ATP-binding/permease protein CydD [Pasteurella multocida]